MNQPQITDLVTLNPEEYVKKAYLSHAKEIETAITTYKDVKINVTTKEGMKEAIAIRGVFRKLRINLDKDRAILKAPILEIGRKLDSEAKEWLALTIPLEDRFDRAICAEERRIEEEKEREAKEREAREAAIQQKIDLIKNSPIECLGKDSHFIAEKTAGLLAMKIDKEEFGDRTKEAMLVKALSENHLTNLYDTTLASEELSARLAAERAEQVRLDTERKEKEQEAHRIAQEALIKATQELEELKAKLAEKDNVQTVVPVQTIGIITELPVTDPSCITIYPFSTMNAPQIASVVDIVGDVVRNQTDNTQDLFVVTSERGLEFLLQEGFIPDGQRGMLIMQFVDFLRGETV